MTHQTATKRLTFSLHLDWFDDEVVSRAWMGFSSAIAGPLPHVGVDPKARHVSRDAPACCGWHPLSPTPLAEEHLDDLFGPSAWNSARSSISDPKHLGDKLA
jgi:hypothetical protein